MLLLQIISACTDITYMTIFNV
jgi:hypothetical protein